MANFIVFDISGHDPDRGSVRYVIDRAIQFSQAQPVRAEWLAKASQIEELNVALGQGAASSVFTVNHAGDVLDHVRRRLEEGGVADEPLPDSIYTFHHTILNQLRSQRSRGVPISAYAFSDLLIRVNQSVRRVGPPTTPVSAPGAVSKRHRRYEVFKTKAKKLGIYAEWRARRLIFSAAEELSTVEPGLSVVQLRRKAGDSARSKAVAENFDLPRNCFHAANESVFHVMLAAEVLLTQNGYPVKLTDNEFSAKVCSLAPDFANKCDLYVLETLINEFGDVSSDDFLPIAHLLYGEGRGETEGGPSISSLETRVEGLFAEFGDRLMKDTAGFYRVKGISSEKVQSISLG
jgi:hypothetical protein